MLALAEFIMRGRAQAAVVALLGALLPLLSPAAVALVCLRRGALDGAYVLAWALLPAVVSLWLAREDALMIWATIAGTFVVYAAALLLKLQPSWSRMLMGLVALSSAAMLLLQVFLPASVQAFVDILNEVLAQLQQTAKSEQTLTVNAAFVGGLLSFGVVLHGVCSLALGRWWQSLLYNPGGFQAEFHSLRLSPVQASICLLATLYSSLVATELLVWSLVFSLPLLVAGLALVHRVVAAKKWGGQWLFLLYVTLMFAYGITLLIALAFIDSWVNFRARFRAKV